MSDPNEETRLIRKSSSGADALPNPLPPPSNYGAPQRDPEQTIYGGGAANSTPTPGTRIIRNNVSGPDPAPAAKSDDQTELVRRSSGAAAGTTAASPDDLPEGPVVGWLVVLEGPGRGKSLTLGFGRNSIGRDPSNRVVLPFGDMQISGDHAILTYDPRGRKYFIQPAEKAKNCTYIGEDSVLSPAALKSGDNIRLGDTTVLKFIPLCGDDFNWD